MKSLFKLASLLLAASTTLLAQKPDAPPIDPIPASVTYAPANPSLPAIFIVGDSTAHGWAPQMLPFFDPAKVNVIPAGESGRSTRTYLSEGLWARILKQLRPNDIVLIQWGHNDAGPILDTNRCRGTLGGIGDETKEIDNPLTHQHEVVHTYGWYLRQYVEDVKAKGATPILLTLTPHNIWKDGHMRPDPGGYVPWTVAIAKEEDVALVDVNAILGGHFESIGEAKATAVYAPDDKIHVTAAGWNLYAFSILYGLKGLPDSPVTPFLSAKGKAVPPATTNE